MTYWIFKVSKQKLYPDIHGQAYIYDNTHSTKVDLGDEFVYLDKRNNDYAFTGFGTIQDLLERPATEQEIRNNRVRIIYTAKLGNVRWFSRPLSIALRKEEGVRNRKLLGIENALSWGLSMSRIDEAMFSRIKDLGTK